VNDVQTSLAELTAAEHEIEHTFVQEEMPASPPPLPTVEEALPGLLPGLRTGEVNVLGPFAVPGFNPRHLRIYLPRGYTPDQEGGNFGLWMFDAQNIFGDEGSFSGGWHLHEAVERLARHGRPAPVIVGIDHGGVERIRELCPFDWEETAGQIALFVDWITGSLMPILGAALRLKEGPVGAVAGGSSMGGLAALWAHFHHPHSFGGALAMSPSIWLADRAIFADLQAQPIPPLSRIYLDMGGREDKGRMLPLAAALAEDLKSRGWGADRLLWRPDAKGGHNEASWRRRLPKALRFLYR